MSTTKLPHAYGALISERERNCHKRHEIYYPLGRRPGRIKPIFHCDAKPFTLGPGVGLDHQRHNFALEIPKCRYPKNAKVCVIPNANFKICLTPNAKHQCESVEYRLRWVPNATFLRWPCTFIFMFFVLISFTFGSQRKPRIQWNMGFKDWAYRWPIYVRDVGRKWTLSLLGLN